MIDPDTRATINNMLSYQSDEKIARYVGVNVDLVAQIRGNSRRGR